MIFLRHPRPDSTQGLCYGRTDLDIGPDGASEIAAALESTPNVECVVASPALRCRRLAEELAARDGAALVFEPRLQELDFGEWDGTKWCDIRRAESDAWAADPWTVAPPGGETFAEVHARVSAVLAELTPGTALVCHAGPIRVARMILTEASFDKVFAEAVPYATPIRFVREKA